MDFPCRNEEKSNFFHSQKKKTKLRNDYTVGHYSYRRILWNFIFGKEHWIYILKVKKFFESWFNRTICARCNHIKSEKKIVKLKMYAYAIITFLHDDNVIEWNNFSRVDYLTSRKAIYNNWRAYFSPSQESRINLHSRVTGKFNFQSPLSSSEKSLQLRAAKSV